jgi:hypothetical protein
MNSRDIGSPSFDISNPDKFFHNSSILLFFLDGSSNNARVSHDEREVCHFYLGSKGR